MADRIASRRSEAGFSVIEGLIAAALLLIITVGVLPLFSRSMLNNVKGNDSTRQSNGAVDEVERSTALPFLSGGMQIPDGATNATDRTVIAVQHPSGKPTFVSSNWEPTGSIPAADILLRRTRTLRQFSYDDYRADHRFDTALVGDVEPRLVHMKVLDIVFEEPIGGTNSNWRTHYTVRAIQAF